VWKLSKIHTYQLFASDSMTAYESIASLKKGRLRGELQFLNRMTASPFLVSARASRSGIWRQRNRDRGSRTNIRARKLADRELNARVARLTALRRIDIALAGVVDLQITLQILLNEVIAIEPVKSASIFIYDQHVNNCLLSAGPECPMTRMSRALPKLL